ncbi:DUF4440 domain-containing protein [Sphingomonas sp. AOB5]|uniref:YybH family protein n=1 Tax=Sphingomonas sp. AOB5 TaxID=3034017 RepID=UPI0023F99A73|nr:DUF4440 domain-containing protein [Sphingomonas sp. AOB5]MDF7777134.1 DUF4440 domain-containing protein [Sphingomonas sp. AOB5]
MRMLRWLLISFALMVALPATAQDARSAIEAGMTDSAAGWDGGDVDRFLKIYSDDPATSFTGAKGIARGKPAVRARYLASYPEQFGPNRNSGATRLSFTFEDFRMLGDGHALLTARWKLVDAGGKELTGMTTLVFRHEAGGWKIIADHSS